MGGLSTFKSKSKDKQEAIETDKNNCKQFNEPIGVIICGAHYACFLCDVLCLYPLAE